MALAVSLSCVVISFTFASAAFVMRQAGRRDPGGWEKPGGPVGGLPKQQVRVYPVTVDPEATAELAPLCPYAEVRAVALKQTPAFESLAIDLQGGGSVVVYVGGCVARASIGPPEDRALYALPQDSVLPEKDGYARARELRAAVGRTRHSSVLYLSPDKDDFALPVHGRRSLEEAHAALVGARTAHVALVGGLVTGR